MGTPEFSTFTLAGQRMVALAESDFLRLCRMAGVEVEGADPPAVGGAPLDSEQLRTSLRTRRKLAGLTQARLAAAAGIRTETLNRIERGRNLPDMATVRKLIGALRTLDA